MNRSLVKSIFSLFSTSNKPSSIYLPICFPFGQAKDPVNGKNDQNQNKDSIKLSKQGKSVLEQKQINAKPINNQTNGLNKKRNSKKKKAMKNNNLRKPQPTFTQEYKNIPEYNLKGIGTAHGKGVRNKLEPPLSNTRNYYIAKGTKRQAWHQSTVRGSHLV